MERHDEHGDPLVSLTEMRSVVEICVFRVVVMIYIACPFVTVLVFHYMANGAVLSVVRLSGTTKMASQIQALLLVVLDDERCLREVLAL
jgi:hypothetical protein